MEMMMNMKIEIMIEMMMILFIYVCVTWWWSYLYMSVWHDDDWHDEWDDDWDDIIEMIDNGDDDEHEDWDDDGDDDGYNDDDLVYICPHIAKAVTMQFSGLSALFEGSLFRPFFRQQLSAFRLHSGRFQANFQAVSRH